MGKTYECYGWGKSEGVGMGIRRSGSGVKSEDRYQRSPVSLISGSYSRKTDAWKKVVCSYNKDPWRGPLFKCIGISWEMNYHPLPSQLSLA